MNKKLLIVTFLMAASLAQAEVLSWRVDIPDANGGNSSYVTAQLFATTTSGAGYQDTGSAVGGAQSKLNDTYGVLTTDSVVTFESGIGFYVKLFDGATPAGYSAWMSWSDLVTSGVLVSGVLPDLPATSAWNAGTSVVPEPTSMALLAMGVSALLLRRKRQA